MNMKANVSQLLKVAGASIEKNKTGILTGIGIASETGAIIHGMWVSPKVRDAINIRKDELGVNKLPPMEFVKVVWKPLLPTVTLWGAGCYCLIKSNQLSESNGAFAAAAASLAENTLNDIKREAKEEKKEKTLNDLEDKAAVKNVQQIDMTDLKIYDTGNGDDIVYDPVCQDAIRSNMSYIQQRVLLANQDYQKSQCEYADYDDFRMWMGFPPNNFAKCLSFYFDGRGPIELSFAVAPIKGSKLNMNVIRYNYWPSFSQANTKDLESPKDLALSELNHLTSQTRTM